MTGVYRMSIISNLVCHVLHVGMKRDYREQL